MTMHADEIDVSPELVARLVAGQFPQWAGLPLRPVPTAGTVNALYRLGERMVVRLPRVAWGADTELAERRWLRQLAPYLPVAIPTPIETGEPTDEYPWPWLVLDWLDGTNPIPGQLTAPVELAAGLAELVRAFWRIDLPDAPRAYRGGPLDTQDPHVRQAIAELTGTIDTDAAGAAWAAALAAPAWTGPPTWVHADLMPGNLLTTVDGRLSGVIDFATVGVGDPACDLIVAWNLLPAGVRADFRAAVGADDATWARARGRALAISLIALPYYRHTNPRFAAEVRYTINEIVADHRQDVG
ncbi:aminoglycoside phosphotransferase family protein [Plantactinospora sonchi]|uniref:Aminoglycoside phosphotransferase family protein n=1 Tax=Plantactinospora sonchi TaxID=1544735 RepID=A0ABU7RQ29_9ACTN